jgi:hypothetical protein
MLSSRQFGKRLRVIPEQVAGYLVGNGVYRRKKLLDGAVPLGLVNCGRVFVLAENTAQLQLCGEFFQTRTPNCPTV